MFWLPRFCSLTILSLGLLLGGVLLAGPSWASGNNRLPQELKEVGVRKSLGQQLNLNLKFTDSTGVPRTLRHYFDGKRPVLLTLNYFRCPMLCTLQLNGMIKSLEGLPRRFDKNFRIVTISFDPKEGPALAKKKRKSYRAQLGKRKLDWDFLVGSQASIKALTQALGFSYKYVPEQKQYAHPSVIYVLTPQGKVSKYLTGIEFLSRDLKFALITASKGKLGTIVDAFVMSCFVYNSSEGKYSGFAYGIVRLGGGLTVLTLGLLLGFLWLRERQRRHQEVESSS